MNHGGSGQSNSRMRKVGILLISAFLISLSSQAQSITYYWQGANGTSANWTTAGSWNTSPTGAAGGTTRGTVLASDILIIQDGTSAAPKIVSVDFGTSGSTAAQTIGRLILRGFSELHVPTGNNAATIKNLTITGRGLLNATTSDETTTAIQDLSVEIGASVKVIGDGANGNPATRSNLNFLLGTNSGPFPNATANVAGSLTFSAPAGTNGNGIVTHTIQGTMAGTVRFVSGSRLTIMDLPGGDTYAGLSFNGPVGLAVFESGSFLDQQIGSDNYGPVLFNNGSTYQYDGGTFGPLTTDRTYGNLTFANSATDATLTSGFSLFVFNNLSKTAGSTSVVNVQTTNTEIGGNIINNAGTLNFIPSPGGSVTLNGSTGQSIISSGSPLPATVFGPNAIVIIKNSSTQGVTLATPITIQNRLELTLGMVNTTATNLLTLPASATVMGGSSSDNTGVGGSFVNGPVARTTTGAVSSLEFPVGKVGTNGAKNFRPMTLNTTSQTNAVTYVGEQIENLPTQPVQPSPLTRVSFRRYFTVTPNVAPTGTGFSANITLTFGADDFVNLPADPTFVIAKRNLPAQWTNISRTTNTGMANGGAPVSGTLTSGPFTSFSDFSLASTSTRAPFPGENPLPVSLTRFNAASKGTGIALSWATASEKNSAYFDVQRSATGETYETIGRVAAQGTSSSLREYDFTDARPLAGRAYYRLRQVDTDGTTAYSPVATARGGTEGLAIYPNPTTDAVTLPATLGPVRYRVLNSLGQTLTSGQATGGDRLDLSTLPKGAFFLELTDTTGRHTQRLMRQ